MQRKETRENRGVRGQCQRHRGIGLPIPDSTSRELQEIRRGRSDAIRAKSIERDEEDVGVLGRSCAREAAKSNQQQEGPTRRHAPYCASRPVNALWMMLPIDSNRAVPRIMTAVTIRPVSVSCI